MSNVLRINIKSSYDFRNISTSSPRPYVSPEENETGTRLETYCCAKQKNTRITWLMNTISSHLHRFSNKRPRWMGGAYWKGALIRGWRLLNFFFSTGCVCGGGRLLVGALKRGWALNRGFTVMKLKLKRC